MSNEEKVKALQVATQDLWLRSLRRVLLNGPPLSGKTTSLLTFPRPLHVIVCPGEQGASSILPEADVLVSSWEFDASQATRETASMLVAAVKERVVEIVRGDYGPSQTLAFDGIHWLYNLIMLSEGWTRKLMDDKAGGRQYAKYHDHFRQFFSRVLGSQVPVIVATCWDGKEAVEDQKDLFENYPGLPGAMAKEILGIFPFTIYCRRSGTGAQTKYTWYLRPVGKIQGVGMHAPRAIAEKFPDQLTPDWKLVEQIVSTVLAGREKL